MPSSALLRALTAGLAVLALSGCTGSDEGSASAAGPPAPAGTEAAAEAAAEAVAEAVVEVGDVPPLPVEVADDDAERAVGLMDRDSVPPGTGMVFLYDAPIEGQFWMYQVRVPLTAVFARDGRVVGVVDMEPCRAADSADCERYGPGEPFDTVLETAPETVEGQVDVGDALAVREQPQG